MKRKFIAVISMVLILATVVPFPALAATAKLPSLSTNKYIQTYSIKSSGKLYAYTDSTLKTQKSNYWISCAADECRIVKISGNAVQLYYPLDSGGWVSKPQWFKLSDFTSANLNKSQTIKLTTAKITTYRRSDGKTAYGNTGKGDQIYILGAKGNYTQIIYELTNGNWKMGWIMTSDAKKYLKDPSVAQTPSTTPVTTISARSEAFWVDRRWKAGTDWSYYGTKTGTKLSKHKAWQCMAYACDFVKYVYDVDYLTAETAKSTFSSQNKIKAGDVLHVYAYQHDYKYDKNSGGHKWFRTRTGDKNGRHWCIVMGVNGSKYDIIEANVSGGIAVRRTYYKWYDSDLGKYVLRYDFGQNCYRTLDLYRGYRFV